MAVDHVGVDGDPGARRGGPVEAKADGVVGPFEQAAPVADDHRRDDETELVDEAGSEQEAPERGAAVDLQLPSRLLLQPGDRRPNR